MSKTVTESEAKYWANQIDDRELDAVADAGDKLRELPKHSEIAEGHSQLLAEREKIEPSETGKTHLRALRDLVDNYLFIPFTGLTDTSDTYVYYYPETKQWYFYYAPTRGLKDLYIKDARTGGYLLSFGSGIYLIELCSHLRELKGHIEAATGFAAYSEKYQKPIVPGATILNFEQDVQPLCTHYDFYNRLYEHLQTIIPPTPKEIIIPKKVILPTSKQENAPSLSPSVELLGKFTVGLILIALFVALTFFLIAGIILIFSFPPLGILPLLAVPIFLYYHFCRSKKPGNVKV